MQARHVQARCRRVHAFRLDLIESERCAVNQTRVRGTMRQQFARNQRTGVDADRASSEDIATADGDQIRGAGPCADEVDGHDERVPSAMADATRAAKFALRQRIPVIIMASPSSTATLAWQAASP